MCGIFGIVGDVAKDRERIESAKASLAHRGPDTQEAVYLPGACLGHTLLSIIGERPVLQPTLSRDGQGILTFNGEIYNYLELMDGDPELQYACRGLARSDTIVLVEGLRLYGRSFLSRLNGMFAFAYHDLSTRQTLLVRDRMGIKPLFYSQVAGGVMFASELRTVRILTGTSFVPDPEGFYSYLRFRYPINSRTFDERIRQLQPAHLLQIAPDGTLTEHRWWSNHQAGGFSGAYEQAAAETEAIIESSIELRMRSDHDFSTYLSGGLDSSFIAALASRNKPQLDTYSIAILDDKELDESAFAALVARLLGTRHHPHELGIAEYRQEHATLVKDLIEPVGVPNEVALKVLSREVSRTHRVVLSGEGADEVFGGYGRIFLLPHDWELIQALSDENGSLAHKLHTRYGQSLPGTFLELFLRRYSYTPHEYAVEALREWGLDVNGDELKESIEGDIVELYESIEADSPYNRMLVFFQNLHLPGLLHRLDTVTMAHSVEARVPFLDHRLVEFANTLPIEFKVRPTSPIAELSGLVADEISEVHNMPKAILKDIARKVLPDDIVDRRKMGFPIPPSYYRTNEESPTTDYISWTRRNLDILDKISQTEGANGVSDAI